VQTAADVERGAFILGTMAHVAASACVLLATQVLAAFDQCAECDLLKFVQN